MEKLGLNEIRERFLQFFVEKEHLRMNSASLVPHNDKSLLLIGSGMAPFKTYFTGAETPPSKRVTTCQKCIRTVDIENVGKTTRHGTFFEMIGNFSFGDYFKNEIIEWAWEFVTKVMEIDEKLLYVSVYEEDDEAFEIWNKKIGLDKSKIFRMGKDDNFWEVGVGPCGPCSEIYYDRGEKYGCGDPNCTVGCECDRYMEFWNLVFTQFNKNEDGTYSNLEHPNIDTGMGLERMATMMQDVNSIFDVDTLQAIISQVCLIAKIEYNQNPRYDESIRIITDHIRAVTFMTADGVLPSNEGRGYVLRRLLRRAARHGKLLGIKHTFLTDLSKVVIKVSKKAYPELVEKQDYIFKLISVEETRFYETIDQGMEILKTIVANIKSNPISKSIVAKLEGKDAFKLYDTFGFPFELVQEILEEEGLSVDEEEFISEMNKQKERGRSARGDSNFMGADITVYDKIDNSITTAFVGYDNLSINDALIKTIISNGEIVAQANLESNLELNLNQEVFIVTDKTPLYAESGGQKGDLGYMKTQTGEAEIVDCIKITGNKISHIGIVVKGYIKTGQKALIEVNKNNRLDIARNHSATHLLQKALKQVLGNHIEQAGSSVSGDRLRFDFTHFSMLSEAELKEVEYIVNEKIFEALRISTNETTIDEAREKGAMALFGEKYGDIVRMVSMDSFSIELCGGTHVENTSHIGTFTILSETGVAAGVRRIEAVTGRGALMYYRNLDNRLKQIGAFVKATPDNILKRIEHAINQAKTYESEITKLRAAMSGNIVDDILNAKINISSTKVSLMTAILQEVDDLDMNGLRLLGDQVKDKLKSGVIVLASKKDDKANLIVMVTDDLVGQGVNAGLIVKEMAQIAGGSGGGRPNMAQAGIKDAAKIKEMLNFGKKMLESN